MEPMTAITTARLIAGFKKEIITVLKDIKDEVSQLLDDGVAAYVDSLKTKYEQTKTFLFNDSPIEFYSSYFPLTIKNNSTNKNYLSDKTILSIFDKTNYISIIGMAGSGKTMLTKHIFLNTIYSEFKIPITIELRDFNNNELSFFEYLKSKVYNNRLTPNDNILDRLFKEGKFLFLLDGFDEIYSENIQKMVREVDDFIDRYPKNKYLISSRPGTSAETFPRFSCIHVQPLTNIQVKQFVAQQTALANDEELGNKILETIQKPDNTAFKEYLSNPLLLSMFILTYRSNPELPRTKSKFYWNVCDTLITKHDSLTKKGGYQHQKKSGLKNEDIELILKYLGYLSLLEGKYNFDSFYLNSKLNQIKIKLTKDYSNEDIIYDLTVSVAMLLKDGIDYRFPHKTLQEYFAAALIKDQLIELKEKIYKEKISKWSVYSGENKSFFNVLKELDKVYFLKFFILHNLKLHYLKFENKMSDEKQKIIFDFFDFREDFECTLEPFKVHYNSGNTFTVDVVVRILEYMSDYFHRDNVELTQVISPEFNDYINGLYKRGCASVSRTTQDNTYILSVSYRALSAEEINEFLKFDARRNIFNGYEEYIVKKITEVEHDLKQEENASLSLLDI
jgi:hypothetical protein